jgi:RimJ/RimL family protein N-acetyltransferase
MQDTIKLKGKRLIIRNFDWSKDFDAVCRWNSDPKVLKFIEEDDIQPRSQEETKALYEYQDKNGLLLIAELEEGKPIGEAFLNKVKVPEKNAFRAPIMIGEPDLWKQGFGTDFLRTILEYCFLTLKHRTFYALDVDPANLSAVRLFTICGFMHYEVVKKSIDTGQKLNISFRIKRDRYMALREYLFSLPY